MREEVIKFLDEKFKDQRFTFFAVMTWAPFEHIKEWKVALRELIEEGYIVEDNPPVRPGAHRIASCYRVRG